MKYPGESVRWKTIRRKSLDGRRDWLYLIAMTDEATGWTLARFVCSDSLEENFRTLSMYLAQCGRPKQVRTDMSKLFAGKSDRAAQASNGFSQIRRALAELDIRWQPAGSSRELGGAAPFFDAVHRDLFPILDSIHRKPAETSAAYLESVFIPLWNSKITFPSGRDLHSPLLPEHDLESILATVHPRTLSREGTVRLNHKLYRLSDLSALGGMVGKEIRVEIHANDRLLARWKEICVELKEVSGDFKPQPQSVRPRQKPRVANRGWMKGFFDKPITPIWRHFK